LIDIKSLSPDSTVIGFFASPQIQGGENMQVVARKFTSFSDLESLNVMVRQFKEIVKGLVPKSLITVVDFLSTHSAKVKGVSWASYDYMKDITGLSVPTLKRAIKRLQQLGFIQVFKTWSSEGQLPNIVQIQSNIDWKSVVDQLMKSVRIEFPAPQEMHQTEVEATSDMIVDTVDDTQDDTLSTPANALKHMERRSIFSWGNSLSFIQTKIRNEYKEEYSFQNFPFYNWLEKR
jgi:hypothetical protein